MELSRENFPSKKNRKSKKDLLCFHKTFFLYFGKWNFLVLGLKNFLYFKTFFSKLKNKNKSTRKKLNLLYFFKKIFSYILGNETL